MEKGWIGFAEMKDGECQIRILREGDIVITEPGVEHNVFMPKGAEIDTLKVRAQPGDWHASSALDALTRDAGLNMEQILSMDDFRRSQEAEDGFPRYIYVSHGGQEVGIKKK